MSKRRKRLPEAVPISMAADILAVHHVTIRRWIRYGIIEAIRIGPQIIRIPRSEIARLRKCRIAPIPYPSDRHSLSTGRR